MNNIHKINVNINCAKEKEPKFECFACKHEHLKLINPFATHPQENYCFEHLFKKILEDSERSETWKNNQANMLIQLEEHLKTVPPKSIICIQILK